MEISCSHCGRLFKPSPRHKNQTYCMRSECRRARKAAWQRYKMKTDPDYRRNQRTSQAQWIRQNPGYWRRYRKKNPRKAERNRILQTIRNRKRRKKGDAKMEPSDLIAKMDASKQKQFQPYGQFLLVPMIAKMDALKVNIIAISNSYD